MKIDVEAIKTIAKVINSLSNHYGNKEVIISCFLWIRFGISTVENYIDSSDLEKIYAVIEKKRTIFDKKLSHEIDVILNNSEV